MAPGRVPALLVLGLLVLIRAYNPQFLRTVVLRGFDLEQQISPRIYQPLPIRIVAIDEKSLSKYGQWPWPRTLVAELVDRIAEGHPRVLGVDIIFAEADRTSPARLVETIPDLPPQLAHQLASLPPNETALAAAFKSVPTVLGVGTSELKEPSPGEPSRVTLIREAGGSPRPFLATYPYALRSLPELTAAASEQGAVPANPDPDGITRRVPLFVVIQNQLTPVLSLEMLRVASGTYSLEITSGPDGVKSGSVDGTTIPTDSHGRVYPHFTPSYDIRYVSAADVIDKSFDISALKGGIVFLGVIGQGLIDERQTPLGLMAGVEVHAQLAECILTGNLLRRPGSLNATEILLALVAGLITIFVLPYRWPRAAAITFAGLVVVLLVSAFVCFRFFNLLEDGLYPGAVALVTFGMMLSANLRAAETARRRLSAELQQEREHEARMEGELGAARSIQMGLLPHRFPGPPEHREVNLYAVIEPARMVGGDLYDFVLLESERLFFAIADVSGKGVPAALFMAMTKEVLRDAVTRFGESLDRALYEANSKISAASEEMTIVGGDMMFVTVFAGILNLRSGTIVYVNAGHDAPFVVRVRNKPGQLSGDGGPPLGTVEGFQYPVQRYQLTPGESVLLYTDGVTEAENPADSFYTAARLEALLKSAQVDSAKALVDLVCDDVHQFAAGRPEQADDLTLLAFQWRGAESAKA